MVVTRSILPVALVWALSTLGCTQLGDTSLFPGLDTGPPQTDTNTDGTDSADATDATDGTDACEPYTIPEAVTTLFATKCGTYCHTGGATSGVELALDADKAIANLVDVPAFSDKTAIRVVPGDPAASYLIQKVQGTAGSRMPLGGQLTAAEEKLLTDWVSSLVPCADVVPGPKACELTAEVTTIINARCAGCHTGGAKLGAFDFDPARAIANTVNVKATNGETLVIPGDPDGSYVVKKLTGAAGIVGSTMPQGALLDEAQVQSFRDWITGLDGCEVAK